MTTQKAQHYNISTYRNGHTVINGDVVAPRPRVTYADNVLTVDGCKMPKRTKASRVLIHIATGQ